MFSLFAHMEKVEELKKELDTLLERFLNEKREVDLDLLYKDESALKTCKELCDKLSALGVKPPLEIKSSVTSPSKTESPPIHYIWVGPPAQIAGQDTGGPITMARVNKDNPIQFWCLEKHKKEYVEKFKEYKNITINTIESQAKHSSSMQIMLNSCLNAKERGSIRDRVTVKDAFALFLLQTKGGYIIDTNILPQDEEKLNLGKHEKTYFPAMQTPIQKRTDLECWLMYSPRADTDEAKEMFAGFYARWRESELLRKKLIRFGESLEEYYSFMGSVIMKPIFEAYHKFKLGVFDTVKAEGVAYVDVPALKLRKTYSNTHHFVMRSKYEPTLFGAEGKAQDNNINEIFALALTSNIPQLKVFIENGGKVNDTIKNKIPGYYEGETPLHIAARNESNPEVVKLLLEAGANLEFVAKYNDKEISARDMLLNKGYGEILNDFEKTHKKNSASI